MAALGFRSVELRFGDTLQRVAVRELGDAARWVDIALLNNLRPPYVVDDPADAVEGVASAGTSILIPVQAEFPVGDADDPFLTDLVLYRGRLQVNEGDLVLVSGGPNLIQSLRHRVMVEKRDLWFHPEYGCWVHSILGQMNGPRAAGLAAFYIKSTLLEDERVRSVDSIVADVIGDQIKVEATVIPVYGEVFAFEEVL